MTTEEVRALGRDDRPAAVALWETCALTRPWNDPSADFDRAMEGPTSTVLGLFDGDVLVATVMVGHDGHRGWVYYLAVRPDRQGRGAGRRAMAEAEAWLRDRQVPKLNLMVRHDNVEAVAFYEQLGYQDAAVTVLARWL